MFGRSVKMKERPLMKYEVQCKGLLGGEGRSWLQMAVAPERATSSKVAAPFKITTSNVLPFHERKCEWSEIIT